MWSLLSWWLYWTNEIMWQLFSNDILLIQSIHSKINLVEWNLVIFLSVVQIKEKKKTHFFLRSGSLTVRSILIQFWIQMNNENEKRKKWMNEWILHAKEIFRLLFNIDHLFIVIIRIMHWLRCIFIIGCVVRRWICHMIQLFFMFHSL